MSVTVWYFVLALCCPFPAFEGDKAPTTVKVTKNSMEGCKTAQRVLIKEMKKNQMNYTLSEPCRSEEIPAHE
jgi:hypothetical protein